MSCDVLFVAYRWYRSFRLWASRISDFGRPVNKLKLKKQHLRLRFFIVTALRYKEKEIHRKFPQVQLSENSILLYL